MANQYYDNFVLEDKLESILATKLDFNQFVTPDYQLAENAGMIKKIHKYTPVGNVEDLAMMQGNSQDIESTFVEEAYEVKVTQGRGTWYDEEAMRDPMVVDTIVNGIAEQMVNDFTHKAIKEMEKADNFVTCNFTTDDPFAAVVDALAKIDGEIEDESGLQLLVAPVDLAWLRKKFADNLKYSEGFIRTGYVGHVAGVPVIMSKACPEHCMFVENRKAITLFVKKGSEAEQLRDPDHRKNQLWMRKVTLPALTDNRYIVGIGQAQGTACVTTTYTKATTTVAGTCGTSADKVIVYVNTKRYEATPSSGAWTITTSAALAVGDKINARAVEYGKAPKDATEVTVAA